MSETAEQPSYHSCKSYIKNNHDKKEKVLAMEFITGDVSISHWDKERVIGRGSHGVVYLGVPTKSHLTNVAIKVARYRDAFHLIKEKMVLEKFIGSPEIVQCIGEAITKKEGDKVCIYNIVLEYAAGGTLASLIEAHKKLPEEDVKEYLRMILKGLSRIHAKGFVHSDLKPENILVFPLGDGKIKLKIADFGLSKWYKSKYKEEEEKEHRKLKFRGTPRYMSPESLTGEIKPSLDIWSLGCVLINMISGNHIWDDCTTKEEVLLKLVFEKKMSNIPKELSNQGKDFLQKCFERNPRRRWSANMLLKHPYLVEEKEITKSFECLPTFIGFCTIMILVVIFFRFLFSIFQMLSIL